MKFIGTGTYVPGTYAAVPVPVVGTVGFPPGSIEVTPGIGGAGATRLATLIGARLQYAYNVIAIPAIANGIPRDTRIIVACGNDSGGPSVGVNVGSLVGLFVENVGVRLMDGLMVGALDGLAVEAVGDIEGLYVEEVGVRVVAIVGTAEGCFEGGFEGGLEGRVDGILVGNLVGVRDLVGVGLGA